MSTIGRRPPLRHEQNLSIPTRIEDVTPDWLNTVARPLPLGSVSSIAGPPDRLREGFTSEVYRLTLDCANAHPATGPATVIVKLSSSDPALRKRPNTAASYAREVAFYRALPSLPSATRPPVPTCYHADVDPATGAHVLVLEDVRRAQAVPDDHCLTPDAARRAIDAIARVHAAWWGGTDDLQRRVINDNALRESHGAWWPAFLNKVGNDLPPRLRSLGLALETGRAKALRRLFEDGPATLTHGDFHAGNVLFGGPGDAPDIVIVDWQLSGPGRGVWDVAQLLGRNLAPDVRLRNEHALLGDYLAALRRALAGRAMAHALDAYGFDALLLDYRWSLALRYGALISTIAAMPFTPDQIRHHVDDLLPRVSRAVLDNDADRLFD